MHEKVLGSHAALTSTFAMDFVMLTAWLCRGALRAPQHTHAKVTAKYIAKIGMRAAWLQNTFSCISRRVLYTRMQEKA